MTRPRGLLRRARRRHPRRRAASAPRTRSRSALSTSRAQPRRIGAAAPGDAQSAFARRRRRTGSCSRARRSTGSASRATSASSAWPRRAATRPSSQPVIAALEQLAAIYARLKGDVSVLHAARENLLLPVELVPRADGDGRRGRRGRALHLVPPDRARPLPGDAPVGFDLDEHGRCAASGPRGPTASSAAWPPRASASAGASASAPTTTRCATSRAGHGPPAGDPHRGGRRRRRGGLRAPPRGAAGPQLAPEAGVVHVGGRDVDRRAAPALDADLEGHLHARASTRRGRCRTPRRRSRRARCRGRRGGRRPPGRRSRRRVAPRRSRTSRITTRAMASDVAQPRREVRDQRVEHARRRRPRPSRPPCR